MSLLPPDPSSALRAALAATRRRLLFRRAVRGGATGAWFGVIGGGAVAAASHHLMGLAWGPSSLIALTLTGFGVATGSGIAAVIKGLDRHELALLLDRALATDELLVTALHLGDTDPDERDKLLAQLDFDLADLPDRLPVRAPRHTRWLPLPALVIAALLMAPTLRPPTLTTGEQALIQTEGDRLAGRIKKVDDSIDAELPDGIDREIAELAADMQGDVLNEEEALARLEELQERLNAFTQQLAESEDMLQDLERAAKELDAEATQELADALRDGDLDSASEAAKDLSESLSEATPEQRKQVSQNLERAGDELAKSDSEALQQAGNAMQQAGDQLENGQQSEGQGGEQQTPGEKGQPSGNEGMSQEQINDMSEQLAKARELGEQLQSDQKALDRAQKLNSAMEASKQRLGGESEVPSGESSGEEGQGEEGQGEEGQGEGEGEGEGQGKGQQGPAHTWEDEGESNGSDEQQHEDRNRASKEGEGEVVDDYERLYAAMRMKNADALLASVEGQVDEDGHIDELHTRLTGADEDATRANITLPAQYREAAAEAMNAEEIPPGYRDAVKQYFDEME